MSINTSQNGLPAAVSTSVGRATGVGELNGRDAAGALADQDWFSAQALSDGKTIAASNFDDTANRMSVEDAANRVYSRIFTVSADDSPWT